MWYKKKVQLSANNSVWDAPEKYGWFSIGIEWDSPKAVSDFQEDEDIRDSVEDNCLLATAQLERVGFPKQHSYILFSDIYVHNDITGGEAGASAESHFIRFPTTALYNEDWAKTLVHEWAHKYFKNLNKGSKAYFSNQYEGLVKNNIELDNSPELLEMIEEVIPEDIKEKFPDDFDIWKIYTINSLHKPEMENIRGYIQRKGIVPSSYAASDAEEMWCECVSNYSKLSRELRQVVSNIIGGY